MFRAATFLITAWVLAAAAGCGSSAPGRINIIWVTWDSTRADHLSSYGYARPTSPNVDALAEQAVLFETAIAQHNWTQPSYASMLTSLHFWQMPGWTLSPDNLTLSEILAAHGYDTFGFVQNPNLAADFHFDQGFDVYERLPDSTTPGEMNDLVLPRLPGLAAAQRPFFLFVHYQGPHFPYREDNPFNEEFVGAAEVLLTAQEGLDAMASHGAVWAADEAKVAYLTDMYDASIRATDAALGELVAALDQAGLWEDSLVIFNSDHGDEFYDRGEFGHATYNVYPELTFVPLIVRFPARMAIAPRRVTASVQNLDIAPTVLDVVGIPVPGHFVGASLLPLDEVGSDADRLAYSNIGAYVAIRSSTRTLVHHYGGDPEAAAGPLVYDRGADPRERRPLSASNDAAGAMLYERGLQWYQIIQAQEQLDMAGKTELSEELAAALRALGYLR